MLPELNTKEKLTRTTKTVMWHKRAFDVTEKIASRDHNNLYISSLFFRDLTKYKAFCAYYAVMRIVDDRVDNLAPTVRQSEKQQRSELKIIDAWEQLVNLCNLGIHPTASQLKACNFIEAEAVCESLIAAFRAFPVPIKLWINFFKAMRSDIIATKFDNWSDFLVYAEGATVAPTTIYLSLIAARFNEAKNSYELPAGFDLFKCGQYLGIFAYLGHIIRDLAEDIKNAATRLCITHEDMITHGLNPKKLRTDVFRQQASPATRSLVAEILQRARNYLSQGRALTLQLQNFIENDSRFILELIITMYEKVIVKIERTGFDPMQQQHYLSRHDKASIVQSVAVKTGFSFPQTEIIQDRLKYS